LLQFLLQERIKEVSATVLKVDGVKPLAEIDIVYLSTPFIPLSNLQRPLKQGDIVKLRVEKVDPRNDILRLEQFA